MSPLRFVFKNMRGHYRFALKPTAVWAIILFMATTDRTEIKTGYTNLTDNSEDARNPAYLFQNIHTELLVRIASGDLNALQLAKAELANRGLDVRTGKWVGFDTAKASAR